ncbi:MAG TPA: DUF1831 domain-containing protein [Candidatus Limosilactobacillus merdipullorum]|uniref:DUF1831 domain-containing protein n=1 Tax=Candidatus Limosilactobacillus merdipullorum TaxID=2838653 RepID=A0A9D1QPJ8_9LACO|nr:DUF1831 domain-containing protein [Candidatus Limosilactobacillus merdipullorum]
MPYSKSVKVAGDSQTYTISPQIKEYTLNDLGFEQSRRGTFTYEGSLDRTSPFHPAAKLKIWITAAMDGFKMETVNGNGMSKINIFKGPRSKEFVLQYHFILDEMVNRHIFDRQ